MQPAPYLVNFSIDGKAARRLEIKNIGADAAIIMIQVDGNIRVQMLSFTTGIYARVVSIQIKTLIEHMCCVYFTNDATSMFQEEGRFIRQIQYGNMSLYLRTTGNG